MAEEKQDKTVDLTLALGLMKASRLVAERTKEIEGLTRLVIMLLVRNFPNGVALTSKEARQSLEYELFSATDSDEVLTLRARPRVLREPSAEGGLDYDDDHIHEVLDNLFHHGSPSPRRSSTSGDA